MTKYWYALSPIRARIRTPMTAMRAIFLPLPSFFAGASSNTGATGGTSNDGALGVGVSNTGASGAGLSSTEAVLSQTGPATAGSAAGAGASSCFAPQ